MARTTVMLAAALALLTLGTAPASASPGQESMFQDDSLLLYSPPETVRATVNRLAGLGVDRLRLTVLWKLVAPAAGGKKRPAFDATDPAAYPAANWERYDRIVRLAAARGIGVNLNLTAPAPLWATGRPKRKDIEETYAPSTKEFEQFVTAVARRYTGAYVPPSPAGGDAGPLPRVDYWSIWNEPDQPGWLTPQWVPDARRRGRLIEAAPHIYRTLVDAAFRALGATGHGADTILIGELAPKGLNVRGTTRAIKALRFLREMYCLDRRLRFYKGSSAQVRGCPLSNQRRAFFAQHPGLFLATGFAHHPYALLEPPSRRSRDPDYVTLADLPRLRRTLSRIFRRYGARRGVRMPLYLTEYGYQTDPPDPLGVSPRRQAAYLNEAEFLAYSNRDVRAFAQFLLVDDRPLTQFPRTSLAYWGSFQTGLMNLSGSRKPAYAAYRLPIWVTQRVKRRGRPFRVWGLVRPAPNGVRQRVDIQFRRKRSRRGFRRLRTVTTTKRRAFVDVRVRVPASGELRLAWTNPATRRTTFSRPLSVRLSR